MNDPNKRNIIARGYELSISEISNAGSFGNRKTSVAIFYILLILGISFFALVITVFVADYQSQQKYMQDQKNMDSRLESIEDLRFENDSKRDNL